MAVEIKIELGARSYPIWVGEGVLAQLPELVRGLRGMVATDANVSGAICGADFPLPESDWPRIVLPPGEATKSAARWADLLEKMAEARLDRHSLLVALGGGVVGDLAGFAAAAYMRGIRFVQVPTSLLAMVDSSVGGKTGINLAAGKNLAGAFHQPMAVLADTATLRTLSDREFAAGMAEVVKYGAALDAEFFGWIEAHAAAIRARAPEALERMVARCCEIKADVVSRDEREGGLRALLNFGHTMGHAIEKVEGYGGILHGEGVALGMAYVLTLSQDLRGCPSEWTERVVALWERFGLPTRPSAKWRWTDLRAAMGVDKKAAGGQVRFVLTDGPGRSELPVAVSGEALESAWERWCAHGIGE